MNKKIELDIPSMPNYIHSKATNVNGSKTSFDVSDFTPEELKQIGEEWTAALIEHAKKRKQSKTATP